LNRVIRQIVGVTLLLMLLTACGGGGDDTPADTSNNESDPVEAVVSTQAPPADTSQDTAPTPTQETLNLDAQVVEGQATQTTVPSELQIPVNASGEEVLARVNGQDITRSQFEAEFNRRQAQSDVADLNALGATVMDTLIDQVLIQQAASQLSISIAPETIEAQINESRDLAGGQDAWQAWLLTNGYTEEEYRTVNLPNSLLTGLVIEAVTQANPTNIREVRARHILLSTEGEALNILNQLQDGVDFAVLAQQFSNDVSTRDEGGDLGWFIREDLMTPELADVALQLEPGQVAGPVTTLLGYHIVQTLEFNEREADAGEQAQLRRAQFETWLAEQRAAATIERFLY